MQTLDWEKVYFASLRVASSRIAALYMHILSFTSFSFRTQNKAGSEQFLRKRTIQRQACQTAPQKAGYCHSKVTDRGAAINKIRTVRTLGDEINPSPTLTWVLGYHVNDQHPCDYCATPNILQKVTYCHGCMNGIHSTVHLHLHRTTMRGRRHIQKTPFFLPPIKCRGRFARRTATG